MVFVACLMLAGIILFACPVESNAVSKLTAPVNLVGEQEDIIDSAHGYSWDPAARTLTLEDGFDLDLSNYSGEEDCAIQLNPPQDNPTAIIELKGNATITTKAQYGGIWSHGNLTIKSADGKKGYLDIKVINASNNTGGIRTGNGTNAAGNVTVSDNTILSVNGGGYCLAYYASGSSNSQLSVTGSSVVKLSGSSKAAGNRFEMKSADRVMFYNGSNAVYKKKNESGSLNSKNLFVIMDFSIPDGQMQSDTKYTRTYDGKEHKVVLNENRSVLSGLGIEDIKISRQTINYRESRSSDYFTDSDYRDKEITDEYIAAEDSNAASFAPKDAAVYNMSYKGLNFVSFTINPRKIKVTGLAAKDKTYDGWSDAEIDYSGMNLECVNFNSGETKNQVIMECDTDKYGSDIVPCVKASFMDGSSGSAAKSADVAYEGTGISAKVVSKNVKIEEITLSDPNYEVTQPGADGSATQTSAAAKIFPRSLNDSKITAEMTNNTTQWRKEPGKDEWSVAWNKDGFRENDFTITLKDSSAKTDDGKGEIYTLKAGSQGGGDNYDYLVNPNSSLISDIGTYDIKVAAKAGNGNYTDTRILKWKIRKARTGVTIDKTPAKIYETGEPHTAEPGSNKNGLYYTVKDTEYNINITDGLASGDITVRYKGRGATSYTESETAPSAAGDYTVTVSYKGSGTYEASSNSFDYTISPLRIDLSELAIGTYDKHESKNAIWAAAAGNSGKDPVLYNGSFRSPSIWVADSEGNVSKLAENTDYTASGDTSQVENNRVTTDPGADEKPYRITVTGVDKYIGSCVVPWNIKRLESSITAVPGNAKWKAGGGDTWTVIYEPKADYAGTDFYNPKFSFDYDNEDYKRLNINIGNKVEYCYTNTDSDTVMYDTMPTDAGSYKAKITLPATEHYEKSTCEVSYRILPRPVMLSRVNQAAYDNNKNKAETSKVYDGTVSAVLDMSDSRWKDENGKEITELAGILSKADYSDPAKSPVKYTAAYAQKDVNRGAAIDVTLSGLAFDSSNTSVKTCNYRIKSSGNLDKIKGVIDPYSIGIKDVSAADKIYDGSADATVTVTLEDIKLASDVEEKVLPVVRGSFEETGSEKAGKDVNKNGGKIYAKNVSITYDGLNPGNNNTDANNYDLLIKDENKTTQAVIKPKSVRFNGLTAEDKTYDGSKTAKLNWGGITLSGLVSGDESSVVPDKKTYAEYAEYDDPDVRFDEDGYVIAKEGEVFAAGLDFAGSSDAQNPAWNYTADKSVKFTGIINPKILTGAEWNFDEDNYSKLPTAAYPAESLAAGDECDAVVAYFTKSDADNNNYSNPVKDNEFADDTVYVARITDLSNSNYALSDNDDGRNYEFYYDHDPDQIDIEVEEFGPVTYGTDVPDIVFTHSNTYLDKLEDKGSSLITYTYSGSSLDGKSYYSSGTIDEVKAPVRAGQYKVKVEIPATYHFKAGSDSADFEIEPKPLAGLEWTFDDKKLRAVPSAAFKKDDSGRIEGIVDDDKCEPVAEFFETADTYCSNPLVQSSLKAGTTYRAKATGTDNPNYCLSDTDETRYFNFKYNDNPAPSGGSGGSGGSGEQAAADKLDVINYIGHGSDEMYTVAYGKSLSKPELAIANTDILGMSKAEQEKYFAYLYEGEDVNGNKYSDTTAPTNAGTYRLTVTQAATEHFPQEEVTVSFRIMPAVIDSVVWNFDSVNQMPAAYASESGGAIDGDKLRVGMKVGIYNKSDTEFTVPLRQDQLIPGKVYVARVDSTADSNYAVANELKSRIYTFSYALNNVTRNIAARSGKLALNSSIGLSWKGKKLTLKWGGSEIADGYYVYIAKGNGKFKKAATVKNKTSYSGSRNIDMRGSSKSVYKAYVKTYIVVNGKRITIAESNHLSIGGSKAKCSNAKRIVTDMKSVKLSEGASKSLKAYVIAKKYTGKKTKTVKLKGSASGLTYWSTDSKTATVSSKGSLKGKAKGKCLVYVMARNGIKKKINVTVE